MSSTFADAAVRMFATHANPEAAEPMKRYMKDHFPFLGIKTPIRRELSKRLFQEQGIPDEWEQAVLALWALPEREYQYLALDLLAKVKKRLTPGHIGFIEGLITAKSWWDTVDFLASHMVGTLFRANPDLVAPYTSRWMAGPDMWLQRTAILFQLSYKDKTDQELLFRFIRASTDSEEFFIQKAIGWSLREYAKTNPLEVRQFVDATPLANLSRREALKHF